MISTRRHLTLQSGAGLCRIRINDNGAMSESKSGEPGAVARLKRGLAAFWRDAVVPFKYLWIIVAVAGAAGWSALTLAPEQRGRVVVAALVGAVLLSTGVAARVTASGMVAPPSTKGEAPL